MFGPDFYPTPKTVARKMLAKINEHAVHFLEPSAGKGDLAKAIVAQGCYANPRGRGSRSRVDVIEAQPELVEILRAQDGVSVVGYDWLTYAGVSYYDAIVMNPPFSDGAKHLLRAWDFLHAGEIVCLLNQETIDNPYTAERKRLAELIAEHGNVESLGPCFSKSERSTDVHVAMVYLKKEHEDDRIDLWHSDGQEKSINDDIGSPDMLPALRDKLGNMEHYYGQALTEMFKGFNHIRKAALFMEALGADIRGSGEAKYREKIEDILKLALTNVTAARAEFATQFRRGAWMHVFEQMEFAKWLDTKQTEELLRDLETSSTVAFTTENIKGTLSNIFLSRQKLFEQSVWNVFVALTKHFKGNTTGDVGSGDGRSGWKTNDAYKVNERLVFPYGCRYSYGSFDIWSRREAGTIYMDLDRVLCNLDGQRLEETLTVCDALRHAFSKSKDPGTCESTYFHIRYYKKGTVHLKWKRADLRVAYLSGADLRVADLRVAYLSGADLTVIRDDLWAVLSSAPAEVDGLRAAIMEGHIDGSTYEGDCACLVGTLANVRHCEYDAIPGLEPNSSRPIERFFLAIDKGDTPETSQFSKFALEWTDQWLANMRAAFGNAEVAP